MPALTVIPPFDVYTEIDGQPLDNGYIFIGTPNLIPETNPINVYFDEGLTILAAQPLRTLGGYIVNSGTPAKIYIDGVGYSIAVKNKNGSLLYSSPNGTGISPNSSGVIYDPAGTGAVTTTVQAKLRETVSVKDFGAVGDGVTNDTTAINLAIVAVGSAGGGTVYFPSGTYIVDRVGGAAANFDLDVCIDVQYSNVNLVGAGRGATVIKKAQNATTAHVIKLGRRVALGPPNIVNDCSISNLTVYGNRLTAVSADNNSNIDVSSGAARIVIEQIESVESLGYGIGMQRDAFVHCRISDAYIADCNRDGIDWKMDVNNSGYGNIVENVTVLRFGLTTTSGNPQAGVDVRTGISIENVYVGEFGANNTGVRINTSIDTTTAQQSTINNARSVSTGGVDSKGFQFTGFNGRYSNLYAEGAEIGCWVRSQKAQFTNIVAKGCGTGVYVFANAGNAINDNVFVNVYASDAPAPDGKGIRVTGSAADLVSNIFINPVTENNATDDVLIGAGVLYTKFIGGSIRAGRVSDSGVSTQFVGCGDVAGPVQFGRRRNQYVEISGDGTQNLIKGVSEVGNPKPLIIESDAESGDIYLKTSAPGAVVRFGDRVSIGDTSINGYIEIRDNAGALRRVALIA